MTSLPYRQVVGRWTGKQERKSRAQYQRRAPAGRDARFVADGPCRAQQSTRRQRLDWHLTRASPAAVESGRQPRLQTVREESLEMSGQERQDPLPWQSL